MPRLDGEVGAHQPGGNGAWQHPPCGANSWTQDRDVGATRHPLTAKYFQISGDGHQRLASPPSGEGWLHRAGAGHLAFGHSRSGE